jgi:ATP-dependent DNA helicase RecG
VISEIAADMASPHRMNRLLQGDVGSGKTLVALRAMIQAHESGWQAALMAPTQILAEQHYLNFRRILDPLRIPVVLRTSARKEGSGESDLFNPAKSSVPPLVVGTHALLFEGAEFEKLGLVVIDEQHKFGVLQRSRLIGRADAPDVLVMTATPIPRTITQTLYGDLDVSIIRERPAGRGAVVTALRDESKLPAIIEFLRGEIGAGRQAYIVYPLVEESEKLELKAATAEFEKWRQLLAPATVGLVHGRLDAEAKESVMREFREGRTSVLVSTTVIEVGVDVPNATIMLIEEAGRFGLSQIHQLRGRIGRGSQKSWCVLLQNDATGAALEKLQVLEKTNDGFEIAEADLRLRGPGDILGTAQTGLPPLGLGDLVRDADIMTEARRAAREILAADPELKKPENARLRAHVERHATAQELAEG